MDESPAPRVGASPPASSPSIRVPILWGIGWGVLQAASPLGFWWLEPATVYALGLPLIAAVYIGFAVADGRLMVLAVESSLVGLFVILAAAGISGSAWFLVAGLAGHGLKDMWHTAISSLRTPGGGRPSVRQSISSLLESSLWR